MKVLVTGATGFLGQYVIDALLQRGHEVVATSRSRLSAAEKNWYEKTQFVPYDISEQNPGVLLAAIEGADVIIHLAWQGLPNYKSSFHMDINLPNDLAFIRFLVEAGHQNILITGTCFEYGMVEGELIETMPTKPDNPYAMAKDSLRKSLEQLQVSVPYLLKWARLFYTYGPGQNPNSLLAQLDSAISRGDAVFNMSGGEQLRDYLPVEDMADLIVRLSEVRNASGIFNVCSGKPISVRQLVEDHLKKAGAKIELNLGYYPYPDFEPMEFWGSAKKLTKLLESA